MICSHEVGIEFWLILIRCGFLSTAAAFPGGTKWCAGLRYS